MGDIFLKVFNLSLTAGWIVLAVIVLRLLLKKAPKWINCLLWAVVALRLVMPFSIESVFSLIPSAEPIPQNIATTNTPEINSGISVINNVVNPVISSSLAPDTVYSANPVQVLLFAAAIVWVIGIGVMLIYGIISYIRLRIKVAPSLLFKDNIYYCDNIDSPFILGIIKPKIFLPSGISESDIDYVIAHENAHLKRCDHVIKPLGFLLLSVYWFNPFIWLAYILLCRDIEMACDQKVIKDMDNTYKKGYLEALVSCSVHRRMIMACPLAFGEVGVKGRIKSVLNYKKPSFWVIIIAIITSIITCVCFLTNPKTDKVDTQNNGSQLDGLSVEIVAINLSDDSPYIEVKFNNNTDKEIIYGEEFYIYKQIGGGWDNCRTLKEYAWDAIAYGIEPNSSSTHKYSLDSVSMSGNGNYRFETNCSINGKSDGKYKVWVKFNLENGVLTNNLFINDGEVYFYINATDENDTPAIDKYADFGDKFDSFLRILEDKKWADDYFVDRISHNYDGKIYYQGQWIYFGYEQKIIYYDHYFCTATDDIIKLLKDLEEKATAYVSEIKYEFSGSIDPINPNIILFRNDGSFQFTYSAYSSYVATGQYEYQGETLILKTDDGKYTYVFKVKEDVLVFDASRSSKIPEYRYSGESSQTQSPVPDGAEFTLSSAEARNQNPYFNATVLEVYENSVLVEPFSDEEIRKNSDKISVSTDVISTNLVPNLQKGMQIRVVYNGNILESYPAIINGVFAIYELDENGEVIFEPEDEVKHIFDPVEICYSNGMYSYVADVEGLPTYEIINNMELYEMHFNGPLNLYGEMTEIKLTEEKFYSRFQTDMWEEASNIREKNKTAWEIYTTHTTDDIPRMYLLLEQNDGTFYLAVGYYDVGSVNPANSDDSLIRWVYKLKEVDSAEEANPKW